MELREITPNNYAAAQTLAVRPDQQDFVATITESLADAFVYKQAIFQLAYVEEQPIGYVVVYPFVESGQQHLNIVRLMIDQHSQGRGYGKALLDCTLALARQLTPKVEVVRISVIPKNTRALNLYKSFGFIESGVEHEEIVLYLTLEP